MTRMYPGMTPEDWMRERKIEWLESQIERMQERHLQTIDELCETGWRTSVISSTIFAITGFALGWLAAS